MKDHKRFRSRLLIAALVLALLTAAFAAGSYAKYRGQVLMTGTVSAKNQLAESFRLQEYVLTRNTDGSYTREGDELSTEPQTYALLPGLEIPQDPFLSISGKTEVPAVLYLELLPLNSVSCTLSPDWSLLSGAEGPKGGQIYVYQNGTPITEQKDALKHISVLTDGFHVEQAGGSGSVTMVGYLLQADKEYEPSQAETLFRQRLNGN